MSVVSTLEACSVELQRAAAAKGWKATVERDFQSAVESASGCRSASVRLRHWPAVGPLDVMLRDAVALELKWCKSGDTLAKCAWDIAKLACIMSEGLADEGFVVAGAPAAHSGAEASGVELLTARIYEDDDLAHAYESWWRQWCRDVQTRPVDLPRSIAVFEEGSVSVELDGVPFVLHAARVVVTDGAWRVHVCPHRWTGERCPTRPWNPDGWGGLPT